MKWLLQILVSNLDSEMDHNTYYAKF